MLIKSQYKIQFCGSYTLIVALIGVKFGTEEVPNFTPSVQRVVPAGRKISKSASE